MPDIVAPGPDSAHWWCMPSVLLRLQRKGRPLGRPSWVPACARNDASMRSGVEEALQLVRPRLLVGRVLGAALLERLVEVLQQLALVLGQLHRDFHRDVAVQVAGVVRAHALDPLAAQAELLAGLRAFGDVDRRLA